MRKKKAAEKLFADFPKISKKEWRDKISIDLNLDDFPKKLIWETHAGFKVDPFYHREDQHKWSYLTHFYRDISEKDRLPQKKHAWTYFEKIRVNQPDEIQKFVKRAMNTGANGVNLCMGKRSWDVRETVGRIAQKVDAIMLTPEEDPVQFTKYYLELIDNLPGTDLFFNWDPLHDFTRTGIVDYKKIDQFCEFVTGAGKLNQHKLFSARVDHFLDAGAYTTLEIGLLLSVFVEYLDKLTEQGLDAGRIIESLFVHLGIGPHYFMEIAKPRAIRVLLHHLMDAYGVKDYDSLKLHIHSTTSDWNKTLYDPYMNMLRNTSEAMSGILGGSNSISIQPYDHISSKPNQFACRISRNISNLLKEESYFDLVVDPAAGSYYIDALTDLIIENSLAIFHDIEKNGGYLASFEKGLVQKMIESSRMEKLNRLNRRRDMLVGTTHFINSGERYTTKKYTARESSSNNEATISLHRAAEEFEEIRLKSDNHMTKIGRPINVMLIRYGNNMAITSSRASFASDFFASAGFDVLESSPTPDTLMSVEKAIRSRADIIVLCGSDEDYQLSGVDFAKALKANWMTILVLVGKPQNLDQLREAGVDEFISKQTNAIETLNNLQLKLKIVG